MLKQLLYGRSCFLRPELAKGHRGESGNGIICDEFEQHSHRAAVSHIAERCHNHLARASIPPIARQRDDIIEDRIVSDHFERVADRPAQANPLVIICSAVLLDEYG